MIFLKFHFTEVIQDGKDRIKTQDKPHTGHFSPPKQSKVEFVISDSNNVAQRFQFAEVQ